MQLRRSQEALQVANRGFEAAIAAGNRAIALTLALQAADIVLASNPHPRQSAESALGRLKLLLEGRMTSADRVAVVARRVALLAAHPTTQKSADQLREQLRQAFDALTDEELGADPTLARWPSPCSNRKMRSGSLVESVLADCRVAWMPSSERWRLRSRLSMSPSRARRGKLPGC